MSHIALVCPELSGHTNPMTTLGRELQRRGHRVTLFGKPDGEEKAVSAGLEFRPIGATEYPPGSLAEFTAKLGRLNGRAALQLTLHHVERSAATMLDECLAAFRSEQVDLVLVDQISFPAGTVAEKLGLPFVSISNALLLNQEPSVPPAVSPWSYRDTWWGRCRNRAGYAAIRFLAGGIRRVIAAQRQTWRLPPYRDLDDHFSKLAQISQQPVGFEFPRRALPACFHFAGPFHSLADRAPTPFPFEKLTGQPLIYASMGTLQNRLAHVFPTIAAACVGLDAQLVIALGGADPAELPALPGSPLIVRFAPQLELLSRAALTVTHAGLNTTLESLANGVPLVAIPITNDQPGVAARLAWTGAGDVVPLARLSIARLRQSIERVQSEASFRQQAAQIQLEIAASSGARRAADIIERVAATGRPVLRAM